MIGLPFFLGGLALHQHMSIEALNLPKCLRQWKKRKKKNKGNIRLPVIMWTLRQPRMRGASLVLSVRCLRSILVWRMLNVARLAISIWWRLVWCSTGYRPAPRHYASSRACDPE